MSDPVGRVAPLRPGDPRAVGPYELVGRLGEGGMGVVYLARTSARSLVAVKVIRDVLAGDDEFRRRFQSEVLRARQVPPFCTAEVLDADPGHDPPYLVVEYVDGPTLADVVQERGPLTAANLHSVAIGVATALTAIHGAGVIHRDLKPRNVLLAPGSPKVIDFGIARALTGSTAYTRTDQMVGTVAYMAPERFDTEGRVLLTSAADVFAWGAVVTYAGRGVPPFGHDSPTATAARILTQPPDLTGLPDSLRELVDRSLAKEPADRPSARELLDALLTTGRQPLPAAAAALAEQPALEAAAQEARASTAPGPAEAGTAPVATRSLSTDVPADESATRPVTQAKAGTTARRGRRRSTWAILSTTVAVLLGAAVLYVAPPVGELLRDLAATAGAADPHAEPTRSVEPAPSQAADPPAGRVLVEDSLAKPDDWTNFSMKREGARCRLDGELIVTRKKRGSYRCASPRYYAGPDQAVEVDVTLKTGDSCGAIWFRFDRVQGYQLRICRYGFLVGSHRNTAQPTVKRALGFNVPLEVGQTVRVGLAVEGEWASVWFDGRPMGMVRLDEPDLQEGRIHLGIFTEPVDAGPFEVRFANVKIYSLGD